MSRAALKQLSRKELSVEELYEMLDAFSNMTPQAVALIGVSLLEDALRVAILRKLPRKLSNNDLAGLFENDGPIAGIGARSALAFALDIIGEDTRADLHCLKDIRNAFAHSRITLDFDTPEIAEACRALTIVRRLNFPHGAVGWPPTEPKSIFRATIRLTWLHITQRGADGSSVLATP
jgi:DNA-binding MltR family transcriptional regulator